MKITFNHTGYTHQGEKYEAGTHEVTPEEYAHFKPYSIDKDKPEEAVITTGGPHKKGTTR